MEKWKIRQIFVDLSIIPASALHRKWCQKKHKLQQAQRTHVRSLKAFCLSMPNIFVKINAEHTVTQISRPVRGFSNLKSMLVRSINYDIQENALKIFLRALKQFKNN